MGAYWTHHLAACFSSFLKSDLPFLRVLSVSLCGSRLLSVITAGRSVVPTVYLSSSPLMDFSGLCFPPRRTQRISVCLGVEFLHETCISDTPVVLSEGPTPVCPLPPRVRGCFPSPPSPALGRASPPLSAPLLGGKWYFRGDLICSFLIISRCVLSCERHMLIFCPFFQLGCLFFLLISNRSSHGLDFHSLSFTRITNIFPQPAICLLTWPKLSFLNKSY